MDFKETLPGLHLDSMATWLSVATLINLKGFKDMHEARYQDGATTTSR